MKNPYQSPKNQIEVQNEGLVEGELEDVAKGQKFLIYSVIGSFLINVAFKSGLPFFLGLMVLLGLMALSIIGILKITNAMNYSVGIKIVSIIALFIPLVSLIVMIVYSIKATKVLRKAGYEVGFFGVKS